MAGGRDPARARRQPARRRAGELAGDDADRRRSRCRAGFLRTAFRRRCAPWSSVPTMLDERAKRRGPARRRSRCATWPIATTNCISRLLTDFHDAHRGDDARATRRSLRRAKEGIEALEREISRATAATAFFLFHRPRRWNAQRGRLDGLRAQARQARRPQRAAAGQAGRSLLADRRRDVRACRREVRHHARHRHAAAARRGAATRRDDGASAEPAAFRRGDAARCAKATASCSRAWR